MEILAYIGPLPEALQNEGIRILLSLSLPGAVRLQTLNDREMVISQQLRGTEHFRQLAITPVTPNWIAQMQEGMGGMVDSLGPTTRFRFRHPAFEGTSFDWLFPDINTLTIESVPVRTPPPVLG